VTSVDPGLPAERVVADHRLTSYDLLAVADHLAYRDEGPGRPQPARLRRAVSTAYYPLFHHLGALAVAKMGRTAALEQGQQDSVRRWISHTDLRKLCDSVGNPRSAVGQLMAPVLDGRISTLAVAFGQLQGERELADYAPVYTVTKASALALVDQARESVTSADRLVEEQLSGFLLFLRLVPGAVQIARNR